MGVPSEYELRPCGRSELSFSALEQLMKARAIPAESGFEEMFSLKRGGQYTNLALLVSDQCEHTIRVTRYSGINSLSSVAEHREITGSIIAQLDCVLEWVSRNSSPGDSVPGELIREVVTNAIVHRDYGFSGSTLINLYRNRAEVISLGGVVCGLTMEDIRLGISQPRNPYLMRLFLALGLCNHNGSGMSRIGELYRRKHPQPEIKISANAFSVELPMQPRQKTPAIHMPYKRKHNRTDAQEAVIVDYLKENETIRREAVQMILGVGQTRALNILKAMVKSGQISSAGFGKRTVYKLNTRAG